MYKHILLPTDGTALSGRAIAAGIRLAQSLGASVLGVHVVPQPHDDQLAAWMHHDPHHVERWQALLEKYADDYLKQLSEAAKAQNVRCDCLTLRGSDPAGVIVRAAATHRCDLVYMASHGWTQSGGVPGSVAMRVLIESEVPVLVHKEHAGHPPASSQAGKPGKAGKAGP